VAALLLVPFLLTALLPKGYMPAVADDGTFTVTLCTTDGLRTVTLDASGNEVPDGPTEEDGVHTGQCIFASVATFALLHTAPELPDVTAGAARPSSILEPGLRLEAFSSRLGARAPPVLI